MNTGGSAPQTKGKQEWLRFLEASCVPLVLICLGRSSLAAPLRPTFELGMPWPLLVKAWSPEGMLLGAIAFLAQRTFTNEQPSGFAIGSSVFYLTLWLLIWCLTVLAPGLVVAGPLAAQLAPLKDMARIGGMMGAVVGGGLALPFIGLYGALDLGLMLAGAMVAARLAPGMTRLATSGRFGQLDPREASGLKPLLLFGALYWIWSIASGMLFNPDLAATADHVGGVALLGLCANRLRQIRSGVPNPDIVAPRCASVAHRLENRPAGG